MESTYKIGNTTSVHKLSILSHLEAVDKMPSLDESSRTLPNLRYPWLSFPNLA